MHPEVHRYLDGELAREALSRDAAAELRAWEQIQHAAAAMGRERAPGWLEARVMASLPRAAAQPWWRQGWDWLLRPRSIQLRPAALLAPVAAMLLLLLIWPDRDAARSDGAAPEVVAAAPAAEPVVYVQFTHQGGAARSVGVAGDFNGWNPARHPLRDPDGDGLWTAIFPLPTGVHKYMFVVDGERWVTDPLAERHVEDGFGMQNALIAVGPVAESGS